MRYRLAEILVGAANWIVRNNDTPQKRPYYRPVDTHMQDIGHEWACGAYSYEGLKSLVEQDGPEGFGATATVKWLIGTEGWKSLADMSLADIKADFAASGFDLSPPQPMTGGCAPSGCQCDCHKPTLGMQVSHVVACCDKPPALENDRTAMMLGLVPDKRTPAQRLLDFIRSGGKSAEYHYDDPEGDRNGV
jgi:hypothetical protein